MALDIMNTHELREVSNSGQEVNLRDELRRAWHGPAVGLPVSEPVVSSLPAVPEAPPCPGLSQ